MIRQRPRGLVDDARLAQRDERGARRCGRIQRFRCFCAWRMSSTTGKSSVRSTSTAGLPRSFGEGRGRTFRGAHQRIEQACQPGAALGGAALAQASARGLPANNASMTAGEVSRSRELHMASTREMAGRHLAQRRRAGDGSGLDGVDQDLVSSTLRGRFQVTDKQGTTAQPGWPPKCATRRAPVCEITFGPRFALAAIAGPGGLAVPAFAQRLG